MLQNRLLLPSQYRIIGWLILLPALLGLIVVTDQRHFKSETFNYYFEDNIILLINAPGHEGLFLALVIIGGAFVAFSKLKHEDETIARFRFESMMYSIYLNLFLMLLIAVFKVDIDYPDIVTINIFSLLLFFIGRFYLLMYFRTDAKV